MSNITNVRIPHGALQMTYDLKQAGAQLTPPERQFIRTINQLIFRATSSIADDAHRNDVLTRIATIINDNITVVDENSYSGLVQSVSVPLLFSARKIREDYITQLLRYSRVPLFIGLLLTILWVIATINLTRLYAIAAPIEASTVAAVVNFVGALGLTLIGLVIGVILSIYMTNRVLTIDNFDQIQRYDFSIQAYFGYLYALSVVVLLLLSFHVVILGLGPISLDKVASEPYLGLFIGLLCGLSESLIARLVTQVVQPTVPPPPPPSNAGTGV